MQVIVIGRGHGGTRLASSTLAQSGFYIGKTNDSGDMVPAQRMYIAVKLASRMVQRVGALHWDFSSLLNSQPPTAFTHHVRNYLRQHEAKNEFGWKLPETTLALPWIIKMFPQAYYIYWTRDPRDALLGGHLTDRLASFGVPSANHKNILDARVESWAYQHQLMYATPQPEHVLHIRYEDFVLNQATALERMEDFLHKPMVQVPVFATNVGIYKTASAQVNIPASLLQEAGYA